MIYEPKEDSYLLREQVRIYARGKSVLDMGAGSGIQALTALKSGAESVIASDINKEFVQYTKKLGINSIKSDLFSKINAKFDLISFNPPYLPEDKLEDEESKLATTGGKLGDEIILSFISQAKEHLNKDGTILLLLSSLTPKKRIIDLLKKLGFKKRVISREKLFMESLEVWKIQKKR